MSNRKDLSPQSHLSRNDAESVTPASSEMTDPTDVTLFSPNASARVRDPQEDPMGRKAADGSFASQATGDDRGTDLVSDFLDARCRLGQGGYVAHRVLYAAYREWLARNGFLNGGPGEGPKSLTTALKGLGVRPVHTATERGFAGVELTP